MSADVQAPAAGAEVRAPSGPVLTAVRLVLAACVAVGLVIVWQQPAHRSVDDLLAALREGDVTTLTIVRPDGPTMGQLGVEWTGDGRTARAWYDVDLSGGDGSLDGEDPAPGAVVVDDGPEILAAAASSPAHVDVRRVDGLPDPPAGHLLLVGGAACLIGVLALVVCGPAPRFATRVAWCWLVVMVWPVALTFLVLEPAPLWSRRPVPAPRRRLTGAPAAVLGLVAGPLLLRTLTG